MKAYDITIRATITKTLAVEANSESEAIDQANETFNIGHEFDVPEDYEQEVIRVIPAVSSAGNPP